ncbi:TMEM175 family protein [Spirosoma gilvum]
MNKSRLEAFSDGVLAIIITIMVLTIHTPQHAEWAALKPLIPGFLSYLISFLFVGIYWGNHHHLLQAIKTVNSGIMLANLNLLFWLSLLPLATGWMGDNSFAPNTIVLYAIISTLCGISYWILQQQIVQVTPPESKLREAIRKQNGKVILSALSCALAVPMAFVDPIIPGMLFFIQSAIWLIPDRNVERAL